MPSAAPTASSGSLGECADRAVGRSVVAGTLGAVTVAPALESDRGDARSRAALRRNNLPLPPITPRPWPERLLRSKWTWITLAVLVLEAVCLWLLYLRIVPDRPVPGGTMPGLGTETIWPATKLALITVVPLTLLFIWSNRFRPHGFWVWLVTFGWGACVSTFLSFVLNTEMAKHLSIAGDGDPATAPRAAVFVAPFTEEATKATILFFLAIALRYRWVNRLSAIALAGLSAAAFAFVENILYYGRTFRAAARTTGAGDPAELMFELFQIRGLLTFFAHPLFTIMTGIGLAIAIRSKSKMVRVLAPVTGFLVAALVHMLFNGTVSTGMSEQTLLVLLLLVAYPMVLALIIYSVKQLFVERALVRDRLTDYARMGWLPESDARYVPRLMTRVRVVWQALWEGRPLATLQMQRALTELAYLRDAIARGLVDDAGLLREKHLLQRVRTLRDDAIVEPRRRTSYPWQRWKVARKDWAPPSYPGPAGLTGSYPALNSEVPGATPLGSSATTYSPVDPRWKPPGS